MEGEGSSSSSSSQQEISLREELNTLKQRIYYLEHNGRFQFVSFFGGYQKEILKGTIVRVFNTFLMFSVMCVYSVLFFYWTSHINADVDWLFDFIESLGLEMIRKIVEVVFYVWFRSVC